jgi:hypothetical protein
MQLDPGGIQLIHNLRATYGKTWIMGSVISVHHSKAKVKGVLDFQSQTLTIGKHTDIQEGNGPVILAALRKGDLIRVDGTKTDGKFVATKISIQGIPIAE